MKIAFVTSPGGHLSHLLLLRPFFERHERVWFAPATQDALHKLRDERHIPIEAGVARRPAFALRTLARARSLLAAERPDVVVTAGSGMALPYLLVARSMGIATVFIEVYDRFERPSLTGALVAPWVDAVIAQWPEQLESYPSAVLLGPIL